MPDSEILAGVLGGICVVIFNAVSNLSTVLGAERRAIGRVALMGLVDALLYGSLGGIVVWVFDGKAGAFVTGLSATAFLGVMIKDPSEAS